MQAFVHELPLESFDFSQVISIMAHFPPLMLWEVLEDHKKVKAPLVLVRVMEMMAWVEMSKTNFPRHMWYVEFKY